ncbi:antibiotic biosynthesis monooxygenase [Shewanella cyperi]|uniref:Antibiotic biosynthesis monooxygenase n=1 Tax=Shewanella cyperi TaxID=2814292 RepID=A0A974XIH2_9GAMM|nr:putative quinol monooxygenase [Shewanella cyperi]QSX28984.1 antibiotic biosynthesis monooxygenase [Shewanella cyperi]
MISRRTLIGWLALAPLLASAEENQQQAPKSDTAEQMYGLIGQLVAAPGKRDELASILINGIAGMPGCLSYIVSNDLQDDNALWVTEVWQSKAQHGASLSLDSVRQAIAKGRPLIAGFGQRVETLPLGGQGV